MNDGIDYRAWQFWLNVGQVIGYVILGVYVWFSSRQKATVAEIKDVREKMENLEKSQSLRCSEHMTRTTTLEAAAKNAPTHSDLGAVYDRVNEVKGSVDSMKGTLRGVSTQVNLLVEHHMKGGGE